MNTARNRRKADGRHTVADLMSREGITAPARTGTERPGYQETTALPVAELLRREGVAPQRETAAPARPDAATPSWGAIATQATAAATAARLPDPDEPQDSKAPRRGAAVGSAAVLCGLTLAGLVALKPTTALSPESTDSRAASSSDSADQQHPGILEPRGGDTVTPTAAQVSTTTTGSSGSPGTQGTAEPQGTQNAGTGQATAGGGEASGSSGSTGGSASGSTGDTQQRSSSDGGSGSDGSSTGSTGSTGSTDSDGSKDGGGTDEQEKESGSLLDPVEGTVSGLLDTAGSLLGR
ncbi:hypothetical protein [Haloechinothrix sp. LS1_15]|uniref:hypothetical protein n=1 Tax=Haloechinothrix sp. LS1_15 TaxID=2652248 RepID=UPI0029452A05|nr:hypothetical protein [Haloechinothrix sp. LS1_15]MDV6013767.1 hypothetical protein [Haloechinothrix sp. LS1_15]